MEGESNFRGWDELAPDVLGLIFKKLLFEEVLEVIPIVCKSWCKVVEGPYCWEKIDINEWSWTNRHIPVKIDRMLRILITRSLGSLRELSVSFVNDQMFSFIAEHAGSLQTLILNSSSITDSIVEQVATKLSSLTTLEIRYCYEISTRALEAIGTNCKTLVSLSWNNNTQLPWMLSKKPSPEDEALTISRTMPKLKHLNVAYLNINNSVVIDILSGCPELESLDIRGCWGVTLGGKFLEENYPKVKVEGPDALSDSDYTDPDDLGDYSSDGCIEYYYRNYGSDNDCRNYDYDYGHF